MINFYLSIIQKKKTFIYFAVERNLLLLICITLPALYCLQIMAPRKCYYYSIFLLTRSITEFNILGCASSILLFIMNIDELGWVEMT